MLDRRQAQHDLLNSLVSMPEAAAMTFISTVAGGRKPTDADSEAMALELSRLVSLYALSPNREQIHTLTASDLRGGRFARGGDVLVFDDGRPEIRGICMTRAALKVALETLKRGKRT
jgi:hypothetical protein